MGVFLLASCGEVDVDEDDDDNGDGPSTVGSFSTGRVSGLGSIVVNEVRFDDSSASVTDDDDSGRSRSDLKLGMVVEIEGGAVTDASSTTPASAQANSVRMVSQAKGPVESVGFDSLTVIGQLVLVTSSTVFEEGLSLQTMTVGDLLEVHGFPGSGGQITATRIEREDSSTSNFKLRGFVTSLSTGTRSFSIGRAVISYANLVTAPALANGDSVRVRVNTSRSGGVWVATQIDLRRALADRDDTELEGVVTAYSGSGTSFELDGRPVTATTARFEGGTASNLAVGARLEVEGAARNGILGAQRVKFEDDNEEQFEVQDPIESVNSAERSFVVRGVTVLWDPGATRFEDGNSANLVVGRQVEVVGSMAADGSSVAADRIKFE